VLKFSLTFYKAIIKTLVVAQSIPLFGARSLCICSPVFFSHLRSSKMELFWLQETQNRKFKSILEPTPGYNKTAIYAITLIINV
jgi:hypothetical protein